MSTGLKRHFNHAPSKLLLQCTCNEKEYLQKLSLWEKSIIYLCKSLGLHSCSIRCNKKKFTLWITASTPINQDTWKVQGILNQTPVLLRVDTFHKKCHLIHEWVKYKELKPFERPSLFEGLFLLSFISPVWLQ